MAVTNKRLENSACRNVKWLIHTADLAKNQYEKPGEKTLLTGCYRVQLRSKCCRTEGAGSAAGGVLLPRQTYGSGGIGT